MDSLERHLLEICRPLGILALYAFGSRADDASAALAQNRRLGHAEGADLDIGVLPPRTRRLDVREKAELAGKLEDLFEVGRIDLVVLSEASAFLALDAVQGALLLDLSPDETARFELYVLRRAGDLWFYERERRRMVLEEGAR